MLISESLKSERTPGERERAPLETSCPVRGVRITEFAHVAGASARETRRIYTYTRPPCARWEGDKYMETAAAKLKRAWGMCKNSKEIVSVSDYDILYIYVRRAAAARVRGNKPLYTLPPRVIIRLRVCVRIYIYARTHARTRSQLPRRAHMYM